MIRWIQKKVVLPVKWFYQKAQRIDSVTYPPPRELVEMKLHLEKQELPKAERGIAGTVDKHALGYIQGQIDLLTHILEYGQPREKN